MFRLEQHPLHLKKCKNIPILQKMLDFIVKKRWTQCLVAECAGTWFVKENIFRFCDFFDFAETKNMPKIRFCAVLFKYLNGIYCQTIKPFPFQCPSKSDMYIYMPMASL